MYKKTFKVAMVAMVISMLIGGVPAHAACGQSESVNFEYLGASEITPRAEITGYIYRVYNGEYQKRLWSYTRNCWIDKAWHKA